MYIQHRLRVNKQGFNDSSLHLKFEGVFCQILPNESSRFSLCFHWLSKKFLLSLFIILPKQLAIFSHRFFCAKVHNGDIMKRNVASAGKSTRGLARRCSGVNLHLWYFTEKNIQTEQQYRNRRGTKRKFMFFSTANSSEEIYILNIIPTIITS